MLCCVVLCCVVLCCVVLCCVVLCCVVLCCVVLCCVVLCCVVLCCVVLCCVVLCCVVLCCVVLCCVELCYVKYKKSPSSLWKALPLPLLRSSRNVSPHCTEAWVCCEELRDKTSNYCSNCFLVWTQPRHGGGGCNMRDPGNEVE